MPQLYGLTREDRDLLRNTIRRVLHEEFDIGKKPPKRGTFPFIVRQGVLDADLAAGDVTGVAMSIYDMAGGTWTDTGENLTVRWPHASMNASISSGTTIGVYMEFDFWQPFWADC